MSVAWVLRLNTDTSLHLLSLIYSRHSLVLWLRRILYRVISCTAAFFADLELIPRLSNLWHSHGAYQDSINHSVCPKLA